MQLRRSMIRDENLTAFNANLYCKAFRSNKYPDIIVTKAAATTYSLLWLRKLPLYFTRVLKGIFPLFHVLFAFYKQIFLFPISFCYLSGINSICYRTFSFTDIGIEWTERWLKINKDVKAFAKIRCIHFLFKFFSKYKMHELRLNRNFYNLNLMIQWIDIHWSQIIILDKQCWKHFFRLI